ncbi:MAG TPA: flagellar hook-basal body complex protein FliE [Vicinamibacterales bacterium]|nr:flagellar hook-basal body complex protein FliE [Vicinamibacterales bacterium]
MGIQFPTIQTASPALTEGVTATSGGASGFGESLNKLTQAVDASTGEANTAVSKMLDGTGDVHEAMIALQRAETTLELTVQMRNKFVQAYQDIMRMPV